MNDAELMRALDLLAGVGKRKRSTQAEMDAQWGKDRIKKQNKKQVLANLIKAQEKYVKEYTE